ncbi:MAG: hypothetical protein KJP26_15150, partial [Maribacter sp.]|nr:hypothetical protein [Maribacter sp.]
FNYTPYAYRTKNYGKTWERIVDGDDVQSYTLAIVEDIENPNLMFLGTDDGLYISFDAGEKWQKWTKGYPTVSTKDLVIHPREQDLVIGTFGRAAWVLDDLRPLRAVAADQGILQKDIKIFTPPTAYQAAYQQPTGSRFGGDALYNAENRKEGAMITYFLKEGKKKSPDKEKDSDSTESDASNNDNPAKEEEEPKDKLTGVQKKDSIMFQFFNGDNLIRTIKKKTPEKAGFHRIYWEMDEKGPDRPARKISKNKNERGGIDAKPGNYKIKVTFGEMSDETMIEVKSDPRLNTSLSAINEVYETAKRLDVLTQTAADAVKQLVESKNVANKYQKELKELDEDKYKDQIKGSKEIIKQIDSVIALYLGKEDKRQGITRNPEITVMQRISNASFYTRTRKTGITATERKLIQFAEDDLNEALIKTNTFFSDKWKAYREEIEKQEVSPFKEIKVFNLN